MTFFDADIYGTITSKLDLVFSNVDKYAELYDIEREEAEKEVVEIEPHSRNVGLTNYSESNLGINIHNEQKSNKSLIDNLNQKLSQIIAQANNTDKKKIYNTRNKVVEKKFTNQDIKEMLNDDVFHHQSRNNNNFLKGANYTNISGYNGYGSKDNIHNVSAIGHLAQNSVKNYSFFHESSKNDKVVKGNQYTQHLYISLMNNLDNCKAIHSNIPSKNLALKNEDKTMITNKLKLIGNKPSINSKYPLKLNNKREEHNNVFSIGSGNHITHKPIINSKIPKNNIIQRNSGINIQNKYIPKHIPVNKSGRLVVNFKEIDEAPSESDTIINANNYQQKEAKPIIIDKYSELSRNYKKDKREYLSMNNAKLNKMFDSNSNINDDSKYNFKNKISSIKYNNWRDNSGIGNSSTIKKNSFLKYKANY